MSKPKPAIPAIPPTTFQHLIAALQAHWAAQGCVLLQSYDTQMQTAGLHPDTFLRAVGPEPWRAAYVQVSRPFGTFSDPAHPLRTVRRHQLQVILKPAPVDLIDRFVGSMVAIGLDLQTHDLRLFQDEGASGFLGTHGMGWDVSLDGLTMGRITRLQRVAGVECQPLAGVMTYELERLAMLMQSVERIQHLVWTMGPTGTLTYGDISEQGTGPPSCQSKDLWSYDSLPIMQCAASNCWNAA